MRALGSVLVLVLASGCTERPHLSLSERRALHASALPLDSLVRDSAWVDADSFAGRWIAGDYREATVGLDPARDRLFEHRDLTYADTVAAFVLTRRAFVRWRAGDTLGTVAAYYAVLPYRRLLPDSTAGRVLLWMGHAASAGDPAEGLRLLDVAERWARERGLNREAAEIARCKAELLARVEQGEPCPPEDVGPPARADGPAGMVILAIAVLLSLLGYYLGRNRSVHGVTAPEGAP